MERIARMKFPIRLLFAIRRTGIFTVAGASIGTAFALQFAERTPINIRSATLAELLLLVGLLVLPAATGVLMAAERRVR